MTATAPRVARRPDEGARQGATEVPVPIKPRVGVRRVAAAGGQTRPEVGGAAVAPTSTPAALVAGKPAREARVAVVGAR